MPTKGDRPVPGYKLVEFLGRGQFGEVWKALGPGNTLAALKFLNLEQSLGRKEYRAIQPLKHLRHANLLQMTAIWLLDEAGNVIPDDVVMEDILLDTVRQTLVQDPRISAQHHASTLIIAMPLADKSLSQLLVDFKAKGESGIPPELLIEYMEDAAKAIDFLNAPRHDLGHGAVAIRHCDVKPENLLLLGESVVLCDFGVSRTMLGSSSLRKTSLGGSLAYMSPESLNGEVSPYSDQFSLAMSYLELRIGELPFENESQAVVMEQRMRGFVDVSKLTKAEAAVIRRATSKLPNQRYESALAMVEELRAAIEKRKSKNPVGFLLAGLTVTACAASGGLGLYAYLKREDKESEDNKSKLMETVPKVEAKPTVETEPWRVNQETALSLIEKPSLTAADFSAAVREFSMALEKGAKIEQFAGPIDPIHAPKPKLEGQYIVETFGFRPFAYSRAFGNVGLATQEVEGKEKLRLTACLPKGENDKSLGLTPSFHFDSVVHHGWSDHGKLLVCSSVTGENRYQVHAVDEKSSTLLVSADIGSDMQYCLAELGNRAVLVRFSAGSIPGMLRGSICLVDPERPLSEPTWTEIADNMCSENESPLVRVNQSGDWLCVLSQKSVFIGNTTGEAIRFRKLGFTKPFNLGSAWFEFETASSIGNESSTAYLIVPVGSFDSSEVVVLKCSLPDPSRLEVVTQFDPGQDSPTVTCGRLISSAGKVAFGFGSKEGDVIYFRDVQSLTNRKEWPSIELGRANVEVHAIAFDTDSEVEDGQETWTAFVTGHSGEEPGSLYLQRVGTNDPPLEVFKKEGGEPCQVSIDKAWTVLGFREGAVVVFSTPKLRMFYEACIKSKKLLQPYILKAPQES